MKPPLKPSGVGDLFSSLNKEKYKEIKKPKVEANKNLEDLIEEYKSFINQAINFEEAEKLYSRLKINSVSSKDIGEFSLLLGGYQTLDSFYLSGYFISKLINESVDKEFKVHTIYLESLMDCLGYKNEKNLKINGNAGYGVGRNMKSGEIHVNGDAGNWVGQDMKSGEIHVKGNAGYGVGYNMNGGEIHVNGNYKSLSTEIRGGDIYHEDKLIVENGRIIK